MLHHVALEIRPSEIDRSVELWEIAGFERVAEPEPLQGRFVWLERGSTQIHLALVDEPVAPEVGHAAAVAEGLDGVVERLEQAGFEVFEKSSLWGERRVGVIAPAGHRVELMEAPPDPIV
ncbi:hypothetical protein BH10ACT11_BH10ACT11_10550 [soil metagenome]